jgi:hypothetical protein
LIKGGPGAFQQDAGKPDCSALRHPDENQDPGRLAEAFLDPESCSGMIACGIEMQAEHVQDDEKGSGISFIQAFCRILIASQPNSIFCLEF